MGSRIGVIERGKCKSSQLSPLFDGEEFINNLFLQFFYMEKDILRIIREKWGSLR